MTVGRNNCQLQLSQNATQLKFKETECNRLSRENAQMTKTREQLQKKLMAVEMSKGDIMQELLKLK